VENSINLEMIENNENLLKSRIFTELQLKILKKRLKKQELNSNERTYYYKYIKPKIKAMFAFCNIDLTNIQGKEYIIKERIPKAIKILNKLKKKHKKKKIIISGSYLFNKTYNDIDVFIFTKYKKQDYRKNNIHVNFLPEEAINSLFISSLSKISISNFKYKDNNTYNIDFKDLLLNYELIISHIINKEEYKKELRDLLIKIEYLSKNVILNPKQLYELSKVINKKDQIKIISNIFINGLVLTYKKELLKQRLNQYIKDYKSLKSKYKQAKNLNIYIKTYKQVIDIAA